MASNDSSVIPAKAALAALACALALAGCSAIAPRESPIVPVTQGSPTVLDVYRGNLGAAQGQDDPAHPSAREQLRQQSRLRPLAVGDDDTQRYWSAVEPMRQRFARLPNPDLVMVVFPHLSKGQYPVPGYVTVFPMYQQTQYALPGEVQEDLLDAHADWTASQNAKQNSKGH